MNVSSAAELFFDNLRENVKPSARGYRFYQREVNRLAVFLTERGCRSFNDRCFADLFDEYFHHRTADLSKGYRNSIARKLLTFIQFLNGKGIINSEQTALFLYSTRDDEFRSQKSLLQEIRELERIIYDSKRIGVLRQHFARIKQKIVHIAKTDPEISQVLFRHSGKKIQELKKDALEVLDKQLAEMMQVGAFLSTRDFSEIENELLDFAKSIQKSGRESYKTNMLFEAKQEKDSQAFQELERKLARTEKILLELKHGWGEKANSQLLKNLLPVLDGLDNALNSFAIHRQKSIAEDICNKGRMIFRKFFQRTKAMSADVPFDYNSWFEGLKMVQGRLLAILGQENVRPIKSVGEIFNPQYHIVVGTEKRNDVAEGFIVSEHLKGYLQNDKVLRFAEVVVAKSNEMYLDEHDKKSRDFKENLE